MLRHCKNLDIDNKIKCLGYISEEDKIGLIDTTELIFIPSKHAGESYPITVDEVKARGKPLVVTNYGALSYKVKNIVERIIVKANSDSLAEGIM